MRNTNTTNNKSERFVLTRVPAPATISSTLAQLMATSLRASASFSSRNAYILRLGVYSPRRIRLQPLDNLRAAPVDTSTPPSMHANPTYVNMRNVNPVTDRQRTSVCSQLDLYINDDAPVHSPASWSTCRVGSAATSGIDTHTATLGPYFDQNVSPVRYFAFRVVMTANTVAATTFVTNDTT